MTLLATRVAASGRDRAGLSGYAAGLVAIGGAGLAARIVLLGLQPISRDEAFTAVVTRRSWGGMLDAIRHDSAPPLSYVLDHLATAVSSSPSLLRLPSALIGAAVIPVAAALGRRLGGDPAGLGAAAVAAALPSVLIPARDARMYAMAATLVMAFALVLWRALERPDRGRLAVLAGLTAAALLTHYLDIAAVAATLVAAVLLPERRALPRALAAVAVGCLPLAAWLPLAHAQAANAGGAFWASGLGPAPTLGIVTQLLAGPGVDRELPQHALLVTAQAFSLLGASIAGAAVLFGVARPAVSGWRGGWYLAVAGLGAIGILALLSLRSPVWDARYASVLWPPLVPLLGLGLARLRRLAALPVAGMAVAALLFAFLQTRPDVGALAAALRGRVGPADVVLATPDLYLQLLAEGDPATVARTHVPASSVPWYWGVAAYPADALMPRVPASAATVRMVSTQGQPAPAGPPGRVRTGHGCTDLVCVDVYLAPGPRP
ncbi:MAG TPA: glycosyltransferase family 39 protein [Candidatus Dormibacteraeota bacterium]